ncbi:MAG: WGR domain-containing protein [Gemmatimonadota bacterium]|nr:WGR domain-containing protein [Gemmatimonadota bacterium]
MAGQHIPADHSRGDTNTIGGYAAVHGRPAAFEGSDGFSYSVEIVTTPTGHSDHPFGAYLLFVQWGRIGATSPSGHLESDFLTESDSEDEAQAVVAALSLAQVRAVLHALIAGRLGSEPTRKWYDVMNDDTASGMES